MIPRLLPSLGGRLEAEEGDRRPGGGVPDRAARIGADDDDRLRPDPRLLDEALEVLLHLLAPGLVLDHAQQADPAGAPVGVPLEEMGEEQHQLAVLPSPPPDIDRPRGSLPGVGLVYAIGLNDKCKTVNKRIRR